MTILQQIIAAKGDEVARSKARLPLADLRALLPHATPPRGFAKALREGPAPRIIAEVKRASPSRGVLRPRDPPGSFRPERLARAYEAGGAAALSVLTDVHFFWGHPDALGACREATRLPAMRKDFIIDPYQIDESRWLGADAVLLIARCLTADAMQALGARARELGMDVLIEVHEADELPAALAVEGAMIGINNRDLHTFTVDTERTARVRAQIPPGRLCIAESGLQEPQQLAALGRAGIDAFLIGERFAASDDPRAEVERLRGI